MKRESLIAIVAVGVLIVLAACNRDEAVVEEAEAPPPAEPEAPAEPEYCVPETFREWLRALDRGCAESAHVCETLFAENLMVLGVEGASSTERVRMALWANDANVEDARGVLLLAQRLREKYECEGPAMRRPGGSEEASLNKLNEVLLECNRTLREGGDCADLPSVAP